jgi:hypothetical protein
MRDLEEYIYANSEYPKTLTSRFSSINQQSVAQSLNGLIQRSSPKQVAIPSVTSQQACRDEAIVLTGTAVPADLTRKIYPSIQA